MSAAEDAFYTGVQSLGLVAGGVRNEQHAAAAFRTATDLDPDMCDAWLGRAMAGEVTSEVIYGAYRSVHNLYRDQQRAGLADRALWCQVEVGMYGLRVAMADRAQIAIAQACFYADGGEWAEAAAILDEVPGDDVAGFVRMSLYYRTERWTDVLAARTAQPSLDDGLLDIAAELMATSALAHLGRFGEAMPRAQRIVEDSSSGNLSYIWADAHFLLGMLLRHNGDTEAADKVLAGLQGSGLWGEREEWQRAVRDKSYRFAITTPELIASRADIWDPRSGDDPVQVAASAAKAERETLLTEASELLNAQIGMASVKEQVDRLKSGVLMDQVRAKRGLAVESKSQHLIFSGPPGTGKTTIARVIAKIFAGLGVVQNAEVIEVSRNDMVGTHLGHTAPKTNALIDSALGGVLFIDEAYTLIQEGLSGGDAFGKEAVDTLLARMENDRDKLVVIIAGYEDEIDRFLASNDGLASRFTKRIRFSSYDADELVQIAEHIAKKKDSILSEQAMEVLRERCEQLAVQNRDGRRLIDLAGNGRFIRNVVEAAEAERDYRFTRDNLDVSTMTDEELMTVDAFDITSALAGLAPTR
ncbi:type VII secretion AAA-ATPase EccA [Nocardia cyriacigeorgica]|uniref:type VII secretion AAA-ATPase EccA n=1 Tax=Nocardia cyriacigeorgica TaxID=135487 RepID=UPI0013D4593A|nr:type VII secretion AAA-ATPase EccA [Nocardia cyriacigeorgica]MBF6439890.1 type VII secretion AAA-ATPase EccA [Nocardia cyriacigeorgica]MBF6455918.1 type VII secretion AAA-ATPase EccA [Nocardia cyriacigeorgica]MBF6479351.1 type VII secretion AAA-ATPase EccA [Nocardia cyriacigeorgica]MBF6553341.1 type VII secretion AAA-ATPase EccA [Nocardia cyriacigeorgica]NEW29022.1 type VII secretion AAA-ATPase EccA [Nocardia cyriacigeorgica]